MLNVNVNLKESLEYMSKATFLGAGMGALAGHAVRVAAPGGMVFGIVFSLSRVIDKVVIGFFDWVFKNVENNLLQIATAVAFVATFFTVRGAIAFGVTSLLIPGVTVTSAILLTAVIASIDAVFLLAIKKPFMFDLPKKQ